VPCVPEAWSEVHEERARLALDGDRSIRKLRDFATCDLSASECSGRILQGIVLLFVFTGNAVIEVSLNYDMNSTKGMMLLSESTNDDGYHGTGLDPLGDIPNLNMLVTLIIPG
jgi:hypothetical protein